MVDIKNQNAEGRNEYTYSASGQKLKAVQKWNPNYTTAPVIGSDINVSSLTMSATTDYVGNVIYENGTLKRILVDGGYYEGGNYYFYITDHLGNNRIVADAAALVVQSTQYYPFGMPFADATGQNVQPYKYNNKELDSRNGLNWYDSNMRYYDFLFPHTPAVDPHAEKYYSMSPYVYVGNNPMRFIDPTGMDSIYFQSTLNPTSGYFNVQRLYGNSSLLKEVGRSGKGGDVSVHVQLADVEVTPSGGKYERNGLTYDYHGNLIGEKGLEIVSPEFDALMIGRGIANATARAVTTGLSNAETRMWYNKQLKSLNTSVPFTEENAMLLHGQRNALKTQAREMMSDQKAANFLGKTDPIRPLNYYVEKYSAQGYSGESLWQRIIQGASTPNANVNSKFGIK